MKVVFDDRTDIFLNVDYNSIRNYYTVSALSLDNILLGQMTFKVNKDSFIRKIWLYKIETFSDNQHKGIGSKMLRYLENFARQNQIYYIEGKYFPENEFAKDFYEHRGYLIEKDGYDTLVCKSLSKDDEIYKAQQSLQQQM